MNENELQASGNFSVVTEPKVYESDYGEMVRAKIQYDGAWTFKDETKPYSYKFSVLAKKKAAEVLKGLTVGSEFTGTISLRSKEDTYERDGEIHTYDKVNLVLSEIATVHKAKSTPAEAGAAVKTDPVTGEEVKIDEIPF